MLKLKKRPTLRQVFTGLVIFMWASSFLMDLANPKYDPPEYVNPLIMLVGGYMFAISKDKEKEDDGGGGTQESDQSGSESGDEGDAS